MEISGVELITTFFDEEGKTTSFEENYSSPVSPEAYFVTLVNLPHDMQGDLAKLKTFENELKVIANRWDEISLADSVLIEKNEGASSVIVKITNHLKQILEYCNVLVLYYDGGSLVDVGEDGVDSVDSVEPGVSKLMKISYPDHVNHDRDRVILMRPLA